MKKMIAILMAMVLLLSAAPFAAFAAETEAGFETQYPNVSGEQGIIEEQSVEEVTVVTDHTSQDAAMARTVNESEPNGAVENADSIQYHDYVMGTVDGEDLDAFVLKVTEASWICVDFFFTNEDSLCVLYDSSQEMLQYSFPDRASDNGYTGSLRYYANAGTYYIVMETNPDNGTADVNYEFQVKKNMVYRVFGPTRYSTSMAIADRVLIESGMEKFNAVIVACGTNFPDALAGTYLAAQKNAPIILTSGGNVRDINAYLRENLASNGTVYLLGDDGVVPNGIGGDFNVKRLGGATRYETNLLILKEAGIGSKDILVCTGTGFADSLSASATGLPILLVKDGLTAAQKDFLKGICGKIYIIGGTSAVSASVEKALKSYGTVVRIGGANRYETSIKVAETFFGKSGYAAVLAYAQNFPDGLCGGPLAYVLNAPMILTATGRESTAAAYIKAVNIQHGYVLGGTGLISDSAVRKAFGLNSNYVVEAA